VHVQYTARPLQGALVAWLPLVHRGQHWLCSAAHYSATHFSSVQSVSAVQNGSNAHAPCALKRDTIQLAHDSRVGGTQHCTPRQRTQSSPEQPSPAQPRPCQLCMSSQITAQHGRAANLQRQPLWVQPRQWQRSQWSGNHRVIGGALCAAASNCPPPGCPLRCVRPTMCCADRRCINRPLPPAASSLSGGRRRPDAILQMGCTKRTQEPQAQRSGPRVTLKLLVVNKYLKPGSGAVSLVYKGHPASGDLLADGRIDYCGTLVGRQLASAATTGSMVTCIARASRPCRSQGPGLQRTTESSHQPICGHTLFLFLQVAHSTTPPPLPST
jgi:hypothetical protein